MDGGLSVVRDRGNGLKTQPVVHRWTNRARWMHYASTSNEVVRMKAVNHEPMNHPKGTLTLKAGRRSVKDSRICNARRGGER